MSRLFSASVSAWTAAVALVGGYLFVDLIAAAPGSPLIPPLLPDAQPAGWMSRGASVLGLDRVGRTGLTGLALVVVAALLCAFAVLLVEAWGRRVGVGLIAVAGVVAITLSVWGPVLLSRDVYSYAAYGRIAAAHGDNPYVSPPSAFPTDPFTSITSAKWRDTRSRYGPLFTLASEAVVTTTPDPPSTVLGFKVLAGVGLAVAAVLAAGAAARSGRAPPAFAAAAAALNPVLVIHTVGGGHNDAVVAVLLAGAAFLAVTNGARRSTSTTFAVTAVLAMATLIKVTAGIALLVWLWLVARRGGNRWLRAVTPHAVVALALAALVTAPYFAGTRTPAVLANVADLQGWASPARLVARGAQAIGNAITVSVGDGLAAAVYAAFLVLFVWALSRLLRDRTDPGPGLWGPALLLLALTAPYLLPWYVAWFVPLLPLATEQRFLIVGLVAAGVLALTGIPAEPASDPGLWRGMILAVHYVVAPAMLLLLYAVLRGPVKVEENGVMRARP